MSPPKYVGELGACTRRVVFTLLLASYNNGFVARIVMALDPSQVRVSSWTGPAKWHVDVPTASLDG